MSDFLSSHEQRDFSFETQGIKQKILENFPNSEKVFEKRDKEAYKQVFSHELITFFPEQPQPKSVYVQPDGAIAVNESADVVTTNQYGCTVLVLEKEGRRLMAHIRPDSLKQNEMGYMYHGSTEEEQESLRQRTAERIAALFENDLKGVKGVLLCNIASDSEQSKEYNYKNQHKVWESLRQKLVALGAQVGILESSLDHTTSWHVKNSRKVILTGYKAENSGSGGETIVTPEIVQKEIGLEEASMQVSLLSHSDRVTGKKDYSDLPARPAGSHLDF